MPIANIQIASGRNAAKIAAAAEAVSRALIETLDAPPETVKVIITEVPRDRWYSGGRALADRASGAEPGSAVAALGEDR